MIQANPDITKIAIEGHTSSEGGQRISTVGSRVGVPRPCSSTWFPRASQRTGSPRTASGRTSPSPQRHRGRSREEPSRRVQHHRPRRQQESENEPDHEHSLCPPSPPSPAPSAARFTPVRPKQYRTDTRALLDDSRTADRKLLPRHLRWRRTRRRARSSSTSRSSTKSGRVIDVRVDEKSTASEPLRECVVKARWPDADSARRARRPRRLHVRVRTSVLDEAISQSAPGFVAGCRVQRAGLAGAPE